MKGCKMSKNHIFLTIITLLLAIVLSMSGIGCLGDNDDDDESDSVGQGQTLPGDETALVLGNSLA